MSAITAAAAVSTQPTTEPTGSLTVNNRVLVFSYGSNMSMKQLKERVGANVILIGVVQLDGWKLAFDKVSYMVKGPDGKMMKDLNQPNGKANIVPSDGSVVTGVACMLTEAQLTALDKCEAVHLGHYKRHTVSVTLQGFTEPAIAYVATPEFTKLGYLKPTDEYLQTILTGAQESGIDTAPIVVAAENRL